MKRGAICPECRRRPAQVEACCGVAEHGECPHWDYDDERPAGPRACLPCYRRGRGLS